METEINTIKILKKRLIMVNPDGFLDNMSFILNVKLKNKYTYKISITVTNKKLTKLITLNTITSVELQLFESLILQNKFEKHIPI